MMRVLRWVGIALLALVVTLAALWGASRLLGPTAEQRQAVEMFEALPPPQGSNAFPALWLLQWDVPETEQAAIAAGDAERFGALPALGDPARTAALKDFRSAATRRYPDLEDTLASEPASCGLRAAGCLEHVRADRDAHAARLQRASRLVERVEAVADHDHYRSLLPPALDMPFPKLQLTTLAQTRHALQFVDGDVDAALAGTCRALGGWRQLAGDSDSVLVAMFAVAGIEGHAGLLAEMLAELPVDHPLPAACGQALAPPQAGEFGLCTAMRGEWEYGLTALDMIEPEQGWYGRMSRSLVLDRDATAALSAENLAWSCGEAAVRAVAEDHPMSPPHQDRGILRFECVANAVGCILMDIARPAYADYGLRMQDARARIGLLRTLEWMRGRAAAGDGRTAGELLIALPDDLRGPVRTVDIDPDTGGLRMALFFARRDAYWSLPLPPTLRASGAGNAAP